MLMFLFAAALPALILFWYVYSRDVTPEPGNLVVKGFFFGFLSTFVSTLISGPLMQFGLFTNDPSTFAGAAATSFFGAAIPEESAKLLMLWLLLRNCKEFDERYDGLVYAAAVGLGFATLENVLYLLSSGFAFFQTYISRAFLAVPGHFAFAIVMGYYYSRQHFSWDEKERRASAWKMWVYPVLLHGIYDTICFAADLDKVSPFWSFLLTVLLLFFCYRLFKFTRNRIIDEASQNAIGSTYYTENKSFYSDSRRQHSRDFFRGRDLFGNDVYYYQNGDDSIDEQ